MYQLHYIDKIRSTLINSPLIFGKALDEALNCLLLNSNNPIDKFDELFTNIEFNGENVYIPTDTRIQYSKNDFDLTLLNTDDFSLIKDKQNNGAFSEINLDIIKDYGEFHSTCLELKKEGVLDKDEHELFNLLCWLSLRKKAHLMISTYEKDILPKIGKIINVQKQIELPNDKGDSIIGVIDLIAELNGEVHIIDNKSASKMYKEDSVVLSPQLMLYGEHEEINKGAFIVLDKIIKKTVEKTCKLCGHFTTKKVKLCDFDADGERCNGELEEEIKHSVNWKIIKDNFLEEKKEEMFNDIENVLDGIKKEDYNENWNSCQTSNGTPKLMFGKKCIYHDYCRNGSMKNLIKKKENV